MLVILRTAGERLRIVAASGDVIWVEVLKIGRRTVVLGVTAAPEVDIQREELIPRERAEEAKS